VKEESMAVGVNGHRDTMISHQVKEEVAVALKIFGRPKEGGKNLAGGVIDS